MAEPIRPVLPPRDPRDILVVRLKDAPREHAQALLVAYEVLQSLHERGVLELLRGALGSSDELLEIAVTAARSPDAIQGIRNLLVLTKMFAKLDPDQLKLLTGAVPAAFASLAHESDPPGVLRLARQTIWNKDAHRGLLALNKMLEAFGSKLATSK